MSKIPLVLFPGLLCDQELWRDQVAALQDIATPWVADFTQDDTVVKMVQRALQNAPPKFALAGLSMGGYCAIEAMRQAPERVICLALLDTNAVAYTPEQVASRRELMELAKKGEFLGITPRFLPLFLHPDRLSDAVLVERVMLMARRVGKEAFLRQQKALIERPDLRLELPRIKCPTLILCGRQDQLTPLAMHEEMKVLVPGATLEIIENCGHLSTMEQPDSVNEVLRKWLMSMGDMSKLERAGYNSMMNEWLSDVDEQAYKNL